MGFITIQPPFGKIDPNCYFFQAFKKQIQEQYLTLSSIDWVWSPRSNSDHQDDIICLGSGIPT